MVSGQGSVFRTARLIHGSLTTDRWVVTRPCDVCIINEKVNL